MLAAQPLAQAGDIPAPVKALVARGMTIRGTMQAPAGFKGYVGEFSGKLTPIYLLPDGHHTTVGVLYDEHGKDLTNAAFQAATAALSATTLWDRLGQSMWITEGAANAQRIVYVFTDTECPFCHRLWLASQPYLRQGTVQVRDVIVAVIAPESLGRGAAVLTAADPPAALRRHELAFGHSPVAPLASVDPHLRARLEANRVLLTSFDAVGTPAIVYRDATGTVHTMLGLPDDDAMQAIFGSPATGAPSANH
ncbi:MAG TPA: thiol:disulfide interchange protein DsbG [Rhodanobacteraceae bacterium]|nr:thiol:disulfide interchange protein DsbG [Rhodanobacteraceae bacterium]